MRPGLISSSPVSIPENSTGAQTIGFTGGFYSPSTTVTFNGQSRPASLPNNPNNPNDPYNPDPRLLDAVLSGTDFGTAGLFSLVVQNAGVASGNSSIAAVNLAVTPTASALPTGGPPNVIVGSTATPGPTAVAINTATATAVIANTTEGSISLINLNSLATPAVTIPAVSYTHLDVYKRQTSPSLIQTVSAVRPGLISSSPVSIPENSTGARCV